MIQVINANNKIHENKKPLLSKNKLENANYIISKDNTKYGLSETVNIKQTKILGPQKLTRELVN